MTASSTTSIVRDTAAFFTEGTAYQFQHVLSLYPQVLKLKAELKNKKPEELIKLDYWYQNELPKQIKARGKDAHCSHEELVQLMKWKQARGKFYPQLNYLIKVNTPRAVMNETKKAFKKLPNLEQAITALSNLKGVGTTMASALLAAAAPEIAPFMADECLLAIPDIEGIDYTTKEYLNFVSYIQNTAERLSKEDTNGTWNPHSVELALWTHFVACELKPELLDNIPTSNGSSAAADNNDALHQNGDANKSPQSTSKDDECSDEANVAVVSTISKNGESKTEADTNVTEDVVNSDTTSATNGTTDDATDVTTTAAAPVSHNNDATNTADHVIDAAADVVVDADGDSGKVSPAQIPSNGDVATDFTTSPTELEDEIKSDCTINVDSTTNDHHINNEKVRSSEKNIKKAATVDEVKVSSVEKCDEQKQRPHIKSHTDNEVSLKRSMNLIEDEEEYFSAEEVSEPANKKVKCQPDKELVIDAEQITSEQTEEPTTSV